jgi:predicted nucleic acid-binding protein
MGRPAVILDTNVFVAAGFRPGSASGQLVAAVAAGRLSLVWHARTQAEARRILTRVPRLGWAPVAALFRAEDEHPAPLDTEAAVFAIIPDAADRKFAALAMATGAVVVSADDDLLGVRDHLPVAVRRPREMLYTLEETS